MFGAHYFLKMFHNDFAVACAGISNQKAHDLGYKDVYDYLFFNEDKTRLEIFLIGLPIEIKSARARFILLDGLTREYSNQPHFQAFWDNHSEALRAMRKASRKPVASKLVYNDASSAMPLVLAPAH